MLSDAPLEDEGSDATLLTSPSNSSRSADRRRWEAMFNELAIIKHLGARIDLSDPVDAAVIVQQPTEFHKGGMRTTAVNGAVIAGLVDCAVAIAGIVSLRGRRAGTIQLNIQFIAPVEFGQVRAVSRVSRRNRQIAFCTAEVLDHRQRQCATALAIVAVGGDAGEKPTAQNGWGTFSSATSTASIEPRHVDV